MREEEIIPPLSLNLLLILFHFLLHCVRINTYERPLPHLSQPLPDTLFRQQLPILQYHHGQTFLHLRKLSSLVFFCSQAV